MMVMTARKDHLRERLTAAAVEVLATGGVDALTARALAERAETTTMAIYSRFGGMDAVLVAVLGEGFAMLADQLNAVADTANPRADVEEVCLAYRAFALESSALYTVMFDSGLRDAIAEAGSSPQEAFAHLHRRVARALPDTDPASVETASFSTWALCHGLVSLERSGIGSKLRQRSASSVFRSAIDAHLRGCGAA
jgi:AcrR family transcriptional regulator